MQSAISRKSKGSKDSNVVPQVNATVWTQPFNDGVFSSTFRFSCGRFSGKSVSLTFALKTNYTFYLKIIKL